MSNANIPGQDHVNDNRPTFFPQSPITEENEAWAQNSKCIHVDSARLEDTLEYT